MLLMFERLKCIHQSKQIGRGGCTSYIDMNNLNFCHSDCHKPGVMI